jgi:hypothetical protein
MNDITVLGQRNKAWASTHLGFSEQTIGAYGCAITCLAMWLNAVLPEDNATYDPQNINTILRANTGGFHSKNLLNWPRLPSIWPFVKYSGRMDMPARPAQASQMAEIDRRVNAGVPVIIYVDSSLSEPGLQQHFVMVSGMLEADYVIADPWFADTAALCPRYGKSPAQAICGIILLDFDAGKVKRARG